MSAGKPADGAGEREPAIIGAARENGRIPALLNCRAGSATAASAAIGADPRFELSEVEPVDLPGAVRAQIGRGARRVLVCGGDGTLAAAAHTLLGSGVELAILPGGTLNHFARDHGVPTDLKEALEVAAGAETRSIDVGFVNDRLFLNTSSVGLYVSFVRRRDRLERWLGYGTASVLAGLQSLVRLESYSLALEKDREIQHYHTPLVFVGVGERQLALPALGKRAPDGARCLHAIVVSGRARTRLLALGLATLTSGVKIASRLAHLDSAILDSFTVELPRATTRVAVDGEVVNLSLPLRYRVLRDAVTLVAPRR